LIISLKRSTKIIQKVYSCQESLIVCGPKWVPYFLIPRSYCKSGVSVSNLFTHSFSSLSHDRSKTSSKASSPHSAI
jgi:hypothetical protein